MTVKKAELEKRKASQITNSLRQSGNRYGPASAPADDRRARRERERALGLVPFAAKLPGDLVRQLQNASAARGIAPEALLEEVLRKALASSTAA